MLNLSRSLSGKKGFLSAKKKIMLKQKERANEKKRLYSLEFLVFSFYNRKTFGLNPSVGFIFGPIV